MPSLPKAGLKARFDWGHQVNRHVYGGEKVVRISRHMACLGAMLWLAEEGLLRYEATIFQEGIEQAVLTNKAFVLLTAISELRFDNTDPALPATVKHEKATLAEQFLQAIRAQDSVRTTAVVRYLLSRNPEPVQAEEFADLLRHDDNPHFATEDGF